MTQPPIGRGYWRNLRAKRWNPDKILVRYDARGAPQLLVASDREKRNALVLNGRENVGTLLLVSQSGDSRSRYFPLYPGAAIMMEVEDGIYAFAETEDTTAYVIITSGISESYSP